MSSTEREIIVIPASESLSFGGRRNRQMRVASYDQLLLEGEFESGMKERNRRKERLGGIYWPLVVAIYLGWSFFTGNWGFTWVVWPIAALIFAGISAALGGSRNR